MWAGLCFGCRPLMWRRVTAASAPVVVWLSPLCVCVVLSVVGPRGPPAPAAPLHLRDPTCKGPVSTPVDTHTSWGLGSGRVFLVHTARLTTPSVTCPLFFLNRSLFSYLHEREHRVLLGRNRGQTPQGPIPPRKEARRFAQGARGLCLCLVGQSGKLSKRACAHDLEHGAGQPSVSSHHSFEKRMVSLPQADNHSRALTRKDNWQVKCHRNSHTQSPPHPRWPGPSNMAAGQSWSGVNAMPTPAHAFPLTSRESGRGRRSRLDCPGQCWLPRAIACGLSSRPPHPRTPSTGFPPRPASSTWSCCEGERGAVCEAHPGGE